MAYLNLKPKLPLVHCYRFPHPHLWGGHTDPTLVSSGDQLWCHIGYSSKFCYFFMVEGDCKSQSLYTRPSAPCFLNFFMSLRANERRLWPWTPRYSSPYHSETLSPSHQHSLLATHWVATIVDYSRTNGLILMIEVPNSSE